MNIQNIDHAIYKSVQKVMRNATLFDDVVVILSHWLSLNHSKNFAEDINGEWVYYSSSEEKRFDTFQQMFAFLLEDIGHGNQP